MIPLFHIFALAGLALALLVAYRSTVRDVALGMAGLLICLAAMLWLLGFPALAILTFVTAGIPLILRPTVLPPVDRSRWHSHAIPILVAATLGSAAPILIDAAIELNALPPPVEGSSAARGGAGLRFALFDSGVLLSACALIIVVLVFLARNAVTKLQDDS